jgi:hypothetical protein
MNASFAANVRHTAAALLAASALFATACAGSGNPTAPSTGDAPATSAPGTSNPGPVAPGAAAQPTVAGVYRLAQVEGRNVPCVFDSFSPAQGQLMEMRAMRGEIRLNDDGTYTEEIETHLSGTMLKNDIVTVKNTVGTYTLEGATLTLSPLGGTPFTTSYATGRVDLVTEAPGVNGGMDRRTFTFRR